LGGKIADLATVFTATGLLKLAKQSRNVAPTGEYDWKVHRFQCNIWYPHKVSWRSGLWKMTYPIWGIVLRYYSTYPTSPNLGWI